jgi:hypothetical protein
MSFSIDNELNSLAALETLHALISVYTDPDKPQTNVQFPKAFPFFIYNTLLESFAMLSSKLFPDAVKGSGEYLPIKQHAPENEIRQVDTYPAQILAIAAIQTLNAQLAQERLVNAALAARLAALEARRLNNDQGE